MAKDGQTVRAYLSSPITVNILSTNLSLGLVQLSWWIVFIDGTESDPNYAITNGNTEPHRDMHSPTFLAHSIHNCGWVLSWRVGEVTRFGHMYEAPCGWSLTLLFDTDKTRSNSAISVDNIERACARLEENGVKFQKKLTDGRQKNIAFALDPDNYWVQNSHPPKYYRVVIANTSWILN